MNITHKSITLPVMPGATVEWVVAQREEMKKRLLEEVPEGGHFQLRGQWTDKSNGRWMTLILDNIDYEQTGE